MGVYVSRASISDPGLFGLAERYLQRSNNPLRDIVLHLEDVSKVTIIALGPHMSAAQPVDQLGGDANPVPGLSNTAFQSELDTELAAYVGDTECLSLEDERRVARDDEQPRSLAEVGDDILCNAITEVLLIGIAAHVVEGKNDDRWFFREWPRDRIDLGRRHHHIVNPAPDMHRPVDILDPLISQVLESQLYAVAHLVIDGRRDA